jgi:ribose transport system substrate-binding protein
VPPVLYARAMLRREFVVGTLLVACTKKSSKLALAVIPKGTSHEFWKSVHAGAIKAARELGNVDVIWKGPIQENDLKGQIDVVDGFVAQGVKGILLAPLDDKGLAAPVKQAVAAGIPVVIFDSDLQGQDHASFVATDNFAAGKMAGDALGKLLDKDHTKVIVLRYQEGSASTQKREDGFLEAMKAFPFVELVSTNQYAGATVETAQKASENLLAAHANVDGVFCPNESSTFGMLMALRGTKLAGKVKLVGFDSSSALVDGLRKGEIDGLVLQNPLNMGYLATKTLAAVIKGEKVEKRIDTGAQLVTRANMDQPAQKELLSPDLKQWLDE